MSEPRRLRESGDTVEKSLLDAMVDGGPSREARARMAATLGIGSAAVATVVGTSTAAGATAAASKGGGALVFLKWGAALVIVGGAGTAGVVHVRRAQRVHSAEVASVSAVVSVAAPMPAAPAPREVTPDVALAAPAPSSLHTARITSSPPPGSSGVQAPSISRELASLERIRRAIDAGDGRRALEALSMHQREFSSGALTIEADYLRIEALILSGDTSAARARARRFLAAHPSAPQARRVESILRDLRAPEKK